MFESKHTLTPDIRKCYVGTKPLFHYALFALAINKTKQNNICVLSFAVDAYFACLYSVGARVLLLKL